MIFGGPKGTVRLLPGKTVLGTYYSRADIDSAVERFIADGVCAKALRHTSSKTDP